MANKMVTGFTLIELLIVVAIVGILSAIAYPNYTSYLQTTRRTEAQRNLADVQNRLEQFYLDYRRYANDTDDLGLGVSYVTENGYYQISLATSAAAATYVITATAAGNQASDSHCAIFTLASDGEKGATNNDCW